MKKHTYGPRDVDNVSWALFSCSSSILLVPVHRRRLIVVFLDPVTRCAWLVGVRLDGGGGGSGAAAAAASAGGGGGRVVVVI